MSERFQQLSALLAARLERVRGNMTDGEFARLVDDVTRTALRFEEIEARERGLVTSFPGSLVTPFPGSLPIVKGT